MSSDSKNTQKIENHISAHSNVNLNGLLTETKSTNNIGKEVKKNVRHCSNAKENRKGFKKRFFLSHLNIINVFYDCWKKKYIFKMNVATSIIFRYVSCHA